MNNFFISGSGGGSLFTGIVDVYADLPVPSSDHAGELWGVTLDSGAFYQWFRKKYEFPAGSYAHDADLNDWAFTPFYVTLSEDAESVVNIPAGTWASFVAIGIEYSIGDRLIYDEQTYVNITGTYTTTAPDTDVTNWTHPDLFAKSIILDTDYTPGSPVGGTVWWNGNEYTINIETGLGPTIQVGQEILLLYYNNTGVNIPNFSAIRPFAAIDIAGFIVPTPELAQANIFSKCEGTLTIATQLIPDGQLGFAVRWGRARGGDTSGYTPGDGLWLSATTAGELTNVKPSNPDFSISVGGALNSEVAPDGQIFVSFTKDIFDTFNDAWDGTVRESFKFDIESTGGVITGSLSNKDFPSSDLTLILSDGFSTYDTTPAATLVLSPGSATISQSHFVYIDKATKTLQSNTGDWPTVEHCRISSVEVFTALRTEAEGAFKNQNWNDHLKSTSDNGHLLHISEAIRDKNPASWKSGILGTAIIGAGGINAYIKTTGGVVKQLHNQSVPSTNMIPYSIDAVSTGAGTLTISDDGDLSSDFPIGMFFNIFNSTGNDGLYSVLSTSYLAPDFIITVNETVPNAVADGNTGYNLVVANDFTTPYIPVHSITDITTDASGNPLRNTSFSVVTWMMANREGDPTALVANFPTATYNKNFPSQAVSDATNYSVYSIAKKYESTGFLVARYTFVDNGGVISLYDTEDLRGTTPNSTAGGGAGGTGVTEYLGLNDTDSSFTDKAGRFPIVNSAESALPFAANLFWDEANKRIGIGTATPDSAIDIQSDTIARVAIDATSVSDQDPLVELRRLGARVARFIYDSSLSRTRITGDTSASNENIGIDTSGRIYMAQISGNTAGSDVRYNTTSKEVYYDTSSFKYKENIRLSLLSDVEWLYALDVSKYDRKNGTKQNEIGIIAEDIAKVKPEYASYNEFGSVESYSKSDLIPLFLKLIQEQKLTIDDLITRIEILEGA